MEFFGVSVIEWVGYAAMTTVLLSFLMKSVMKLRLVNSVGCFLFVIYGFVMSPISKPIIITNLAILSINLYYLFIKRK